MAPTALITGASGLIGSWVLAHWDLPDLEAVPLDHRAFDLLEPGVPGKVIAQLQPEVVVHLAWMASGTPGYRHIDENDRWVEASLDLAQSCRQAGVEFVGTGTGVDGLSESVDRYSAAKARLRRELTAPIESGEMTWLRPYYVFDFGRRRPAVVDQALAASAAGRPLALHTPDSRHDFIHASDVGRAVVAILGNSLRGAIAIGSGRLRRVSELVDAMGIEWTNGTAVAEPADQSESPADIRPLLRVNWSPNITEGVFERD